MKLILVFVLLLFVCMSGSTQSKFAPNGAEWYYSDPGLFSSNPLNSYEKYITKGDTVIEVKICKIIRRQNFSEVMYEENNKVYYRYKNDFKLIYDFAVNIGDTIKFDFNLN